MDTSYLQYGVFVPRARVETPRKKEPGANSAPFTWGQLNGRWTKIGADGKPLGVPKPLSPPSSSTNTTLSTSTSRELDALDRGSSSGNSARNYGSSVDNLPTGDKILYPGKDGGVQGGRSPAPVTDARGAGGSRNERAGGVRADQDEEEDAATSTAAEGAGSLRPSNTWETSPPTSSEGDNETEENDDKQEEQEDTEEHSSLHLLSDDDLYGDGAPVSATQMLTPGVSRTYSIDKIGGKFFGEDIGTETNGSISGRSALEGEKEAGGGYGGIDTGDAACVGERAVENGEGRRGSVGQRGKHKRMNSGSSNAANSPRKDDGEKVVVETRDVACQWDGSECYP